MDEYILQNGIRIKNLQGKTFGSLYVKSFSRIGEDKCSIWTCLCLKCNKECEVSTKYLTQGKKTLCKECSNKEKGEYYNQSLVGNTFCTSCGCQKKLEETEHTEENVIINDELTTVSDNASEYSGVNWQNGKWFASITFQKNEYCLGQFENKEDAVKAKKEAEKKLCDLFLNWYYTEILGLTERQANIYNLHNQGVSQIQIAKELNCSRQNVNIVLKTIEDSLTKNTIKKAKKDDIKKEGDGRKKFDYSVYKDRDMSVLSEHQKAILLLKIEGKENKEITEELGISLAAVYAALAVVRDKFSPDWEDRRKETNEQMKRYRKEHPEVFKTALKKYAEKHKDERKVYMHNLYIKNKEKRKKEKEDVAELFHNNDIKKEFLKTLKEGDNHQSYTNAFRKIKSREEFLNKDVSDFTFDEILNCLSLFEAITLKSLGNYVSRIRIYTRWCVSQGTSIDGINHWDEIKKEHLRKYVAKTDKIIFITEEMFHDFIEKLENATDKFLFAGLYYGIRKPEEILGITMEDIKKGNPIIVNKGTKQERKFIMPNEMFEYAYETRQEDYYENFAVVSPRNKSYYKENEDRVVKRRIYINEYTSRDITCRFFNIKRQNPDIKFRMQSLYPSGLYLTVTKEAEKYNKKPRWFLVHDPAAKFVIEQYGYKYPDEILNIKGRFVSMEENVLNN